MKSPNKFWRYSSIKDFYKDALEYVDNHISIIESNLDSFIEQKQHDIRLLIYKYNKAKDSKAGPHEILKIGCDIVKKRC